MRINIFIFSLSKKNILTLFNLKLFLFFRFFFTNNIHFGKHFNESEFDLHSLCSCPALRGFLPFFFSVKKHCRFIKVKIIIKTKDYKYCISINM